MFKKIVLSLLTISLFSGLFTSPAHAHELDEFFYLSRFEITENESVEDAIDIYWELKINPSIQSQILKEVDTDNDGEVTDIEKSLFIANKYQFYVDGERVRPLSFQWPENGIVVIQNLTLENIELGKEYVLDNSLSSVLSYHSGYISLEELSIGKAEFNEEENRFTIGFTENGDKKEWENRDGNNYTDEGSVFNKKLEELDSGDSGFWSIFKDFLVKGFEHILIGLDHILFVLAILLLTTNYKKLLKLISVFTLAHSITLLIAGLDIIQIPSKFVESVIALSIIFIIVIGMLQSRYSTLAKTHTQAGIIFLFGLFHGLGFASVFQDLLSDTSSLLTTVVSFNIGVELGQIFIIILALPIIKLLQKITKNYLIIAGLPMLFISIYWLFERVLM